MGSRSCELQMQARKMADRFMNLKKEMSEKP